MSLPAAQFLLTDQTTIYVVPPGATAQVEVSAVNQSGRTVSARLYVDLGNGQNRPISPQPVTLDPGDKWYHGSQLRLVAGQTVSGISTAMEAVHVLVQGVEE